MGDKLPFGECASINKPPLFCGVNYQFWKVKMKIFVESIDKRIWDAIKNGLFVPMLENDKVIFKNLGPNRLSMKAKRLNMIVLQRTLLHLH